MKKYITSDKVYIKQSKILNAGRGVYAVSDIKKGQLIEKCPVIEVSKHDSSNLTGSILVTYFYYFGNKLERSAIALGFGSIYNHTRTPNAVYKIKHKEKTIDFIALKDIKKDDEITVNYNYANPNDKNSLWFE